MTEKEYKARLMKIKLKGQDTVKRRRLKAERGKYKTIRKRPAVAKIGLWYILGCSTIVQLYSMIAMWHFADLSPLLTLIGATVGEAITYCAYAAKSTKENTSGGIVYDLAMQQAETPEHIPEKDPETFQEASEENTIMGFEIDETNG